MATTTFLGNATITLTIGALNFDISEQCSKCEVSLTKEALEITAFGGSARVFGAGLQNNEVTLTLFNNYGAGAIETILNSALGQATTLVISPSGTTESATNPEYTITNCYLEKTTPINSAVGELSVVEAVFKGGSASRDIT
jgi:hypothetical protein